MKRVGRWWIGALTVIAAAGGGLWLHGRATAETAPVEAGDVGERIVARAVVVPREGVAEVRSRSDGKVVKVLVRVGQTVRSGELLAEMESESGPIPEDLMEEARQLWRGPAAAPKPRRRSA